MPSHAGVLLSETLRVLGKHHDLDIVSLQQPGANPEPLKVLVSRHKNMLRETAPPCNLIILCPNLPFDGTPTSGSTRK